MWAHRRMLTPTRTLKLCNRKDEIFGVVRLLGLFEFIFREPSSSSKNPLSRREVYRELTDACSLLILDTITKSMLDLHAAGQARKQD